MRAEQDLVHRDLSALSKGPCILGIDLESFLSGGEDGYGLFIILTVLLP